MNVDPVELAIEYQKLRQNYAFKLLMKRVGLLKTSSYEKLREQEDVTARATLQVCDMILRYLSSEIKFTEQEANRKLKDHK